ncbi:hypothetical protein FSP39_025484 [Pinctada imbricata]|uniref:Uncharacterized protein n=1 Tax=Pinctada imbricata TaxID=66713 RepID=A0AA88YF64_PINIB|nr:hypothetical protein FSP39_025484 [Pinctada imbricata]
MGWTVMRYSETECQGVPTLRSMFKDAMKTFKSTFYGYANGDILFNEGILDTLTSLRNSSILKNSKDGKIMLIGKRADILLDRFRVENISSYEYVNDLTLKGTMGNGYNEDYFITTKNFPWNDIPEVVVGRTLYDNFLVYYSKFHLNATIIDSSSSIFALHQKTTKRKKSYSHCNHFILRKHRQMKLSLIRKGNTECAPYESRYNRHGKVVFYKRGLYTTDC